MNPKFIFYHEYVQRHRRLFFAVAWALLIIFFYRSTKPGQRWIISAQAGSQFSTIQENIPGANLSTSGERPAGDTASYIKPQMVYVQGGDFIMGNNQGAMQDEKPEHKVNLSSFWIGKYEVTVGEFRKFMDSHTYVTDAEKSGYSYTYDGKNLIYLKKGSTWECDVLGNKRINEEDHPVIHVSQNDANAYCKWLSKQSGKAYRLPTEAEWEYAAKGGVRHDKFLYSGGDHMEKVGWYGLNSGLVTHPVGKKAPNGLGIYDMSGNAWEWCSDKYGPYCAAEQTDPAGADTGSTGVMRGGGWRFYVIYTRCTARRDAPPEFNGSGPGFRLASSEVKE
jgi:formylglycine-generating enzyme required for sulfatase activity